MQGIVPQKQLHRVVPNPITERDNVVISIGRQGDLLFTDCKHRFAIARILGLEKIPVKICKRHREWVKFREEIDIEVTKNGKLYQPLTHLDLSDFPSSHSGKRFELMKSVLPFKEGRLLDIGCNWGYFSHQFENIGFDCTAVEHDPHIQHFLRRLKRAENKRFEIYEGDILENKGDLKYDVVLALSIFHHLVRTEELEQKLIRFLNRLDTKAMFFEPNTKGESIVRTYARNYSSDEFVEFVMKHSGLNHARKIGIEPETGRPLYMLEK
jgi:2-polyprenyl-3-methyl-5-hydroxy-6-metoxy-1,4-benzoquinol methylase